MVQTERVLKHAGLRQCHASDTVGLLYFLSYLAADPLCALIFQQSSVGTSVLKKQKNLIRNTISCNFKLPLANFISVDKQETGPKQ